MLFLVFIISTTDYLDEFEAMIIDDFKLGYIWVSIILTVRFIFVAIGNHIAARIEKKFKSKNNTFVLAITASVFLLVFSMIWNQYAIPALGIGCMIMTIAEVIQINVIQSEIQEEGRTTVMSIYSIGQNVVMIAFSLTYALLAGIFSLQTVYIIISAYCAAGAE
jgi:MFS family permease